MRKSLLDMEEIDRYLFNQLSVQERALFEARIILESELRANMHFQRQTHALIRWFSRLQKKERLQSLHKRLMKDKKFEQQISTIFI